MDYKTMKKWLAEEGHPIEAVDRPEGYAFLDRISIGGVSMILAGRDGQPTWVLETRFEVQFGDHAVDNTGRSKIKLHLRGVFQTRNVDYDIVDTDAGIAVTLTRYLYPESLDRQRFMDELRAMQHGGLMVSGEVDRYVIGLI